MSKKKKKNGLKSNRLASLSNPIDKILYIDKALTELDEDYGGFSADLIQRCNRPLMVAVVGEYSSGKSTFINALLGEEILPSGPLPTTGVATVIRRGESANLAIEYKNGQREQMDHSRLLEMSARLESGGSDTAKLATISQIELFHPSPFLTEIDLIDTPGLNAPNEEDSAITEIVLEEADAIIWLTSSDNILTNSEQSVLNKYAAKYSQKSICVLSKIDQAGSSRNRTALMEYAKKQMGAYFRSIVSASALQALKGDKSSISEVLNSLNSDVLPLARSWVMEAQYNRVVSHLEGLLEGESEILVGIQSLKSNSEKSRSKISKKFGLFKRSTSSAFTSLNSALTSLDSGVVSELYNNMDTFDDVEPYQDIDPGFFVDDYVIRYRDVSYWKLRDSYLNSADSGIKERLVELLQRFSEQTKTSFEAFYDELNEGVEALAENEPVGRKFVVDPIELLKYAELYSKGNQELDDAFNMYKHYTSGALDCGGCYSINYHLSSLKLENRPSVSDLKEYFTAGYLPLDTLVTDSGTRADFVCDMIEGQIDYFFNFIDERCEEFLNVQTQVVDSLSQLERDSKAKT